MPRHFNRGSSVVRRLDSNRRKTVWIGIDFASTTLVAVGGTIMYSFNAAALALRPFTIVRTRMEFMLTSDQAAAVEFQAFGFGWCVVSDQAAAIGVTAIPTPVTDIGSDLFFAVKNIFSDESALTDRAKSGTKVSLDSKAMRKVNEDEQPLGVGELSAIGQGMIVFSAGNMLVKLH